MSAKELGSDHFQIRELTSKQLADYNRMAQKIQEADDLIMRALPVSRNRSEARRGLETARDKVLAAIVHEKP